MMANEWKRAQRQKRGGGQQHFSLEAELAEGHYEPELMDTQDPEKLYEKRWAETLLQRVLESSDLSIWSPIRQGVESPAGVFEFLDTDAPTHSGYYRVRSVEP